MNQSIQAQNNQAEKFNGVIYNEYWNNLNDDVAKGDKPETKVSFDTLSPAAKSPSDHTRRVNEITAKPAQIRRYTTSDVRPSASTSNRSNTTVIKLTHVFLVICFWMTVVFYYL